MFLSEENKSMINRENLMKDNPLTKQTIKVFWEHHPIITNLYVVSFIHILLSMSIIFI